MYGGHKRQQGGLSTGAAYLCIIRGWYIRPIWGCSISGFGLTLILYLKEKWLNVVSFGFYKHAWRVEFLVQMSDCQLLNKCIVSWRWLVGFFVGVLHSGG
jgi:hypothetical protein